MKAMMSFFFLWVCMGMDVDVHDGGGDGGGGEPPPWKQPGYHIGALDDLPDWAVPDESHLNETRIFPLPSCVLAHLAESMDFCARELVPIHDVIYFTCSWKIGP